MTRHWHCEWEQVVTIDAVSGIHTNSMLPDGYYIERDSDILTLRRHDGSVVARFSAQGVNLEIVERTAQEDAAKQHQHTTFEVRTTHDEPTS